MKTIILITPHRRRIGLIYDLLKDLTSNLYLLLVNYQVSLRYNIFIIYIILNIYKKITHT